MQARQQMSKRGMHSNQEKAAVLSKSCLSMKDIRILEDCGHQKARVRAENFLDWFEEKYGYQTFERQIPTEEYIKFAGINEQRILKYAKLGY